MNHLIILNDHRYGTERSCNGLLPINELDDEI